MAPIHYTNHNSKYPEYVVTIGPDNGVLVLAPSSNWAACNREPYLSCENGWVELSKMR